MSYQDLIQAVNDGSISVNEILTAIEIAGGVNKRLLASKLLGVDPGVIIQEMFMGYKQRKQRKQLYSEDNTIPTTLIKMYYELGDRISLDRLKNSFVSRYIKNESRLEDVHSAEEVEGLRAMYEFIHSDECDYMFDVWTLKFIHKSLYSTTPNGEDFGGEFRTWDVYLPGTGTEPTGSWQNFISFGIKSSFARFNAHSYLNSLPEYADIRPAIASIFEFTIVSKTLTY